MMLILFDIDDTLIDHTAAMRSAATALHRDFDRQAPLRDFLAAWGRSHERHYARFLAGEISRDEMRRTRIRETIDATADDATADRIFDYYFTIYEAHWTLFEDVNPALDQLAHHRLGIISNGAGREQRSKLERMEISHRFEGIFISEECGTAKPGAEIFRCVCEALRENPADAIHAGDRYDLDAEAARNAGLRGVWLDRKGTADGRQSGPIIRRLRDLVGVVEQMTFTRGG